MHNQLTRVYQTLEDAGALNKAVYYHSKEEYCELNVPREIQSYFSIKDVQRTKGAISTMTISKKVGINL